jgi:hypothetical protein
VGSRLYGFPCFPHSVISMVCFCVRGGLRKTSHLSEPQLRHVELADLYVSEVDPEEFFIHLLEA